MFGALRLGVHEQCRHHCSHEDTLSSAETLCNTGRKLIGVVLFGNDANEFMSAKTKKKVHSVDTFGLNYTLCMRMCLSWRIC